MRAKIESKTTAIHNQYKTELNQEIGKLKAEWAQEHLKTNEEHNAQISQVLKEVEAQQSRSQPKAETNEPGDKMSGLKTTAFNFTPGMVNTRRGGAVNIHDDTILWSKNDDAPPIPPRKQDEKHVHFTSTPRHPVQSNLFDSDDENPIIGLSGNPFISNPGNPFVQQPVRSQIPAQTTVDTDTTIIIGNTESTDGQYKRVLRKRKSEPTGDNNNKPHPPPPPHKRQTNIKTPSPNPKPRMTSTPKATQDTPINTMENTDIMLTPESELLEKKPNHTMSANMTAHFAPIQSAIDKILKSNNIIENQQRRIEDLTMENCKLKSEVFKLRGDVYDLKDRMNSVENKSLENNLIFHGIPDSENEYLNQLVDKLQRNFADTIDIYDDDARIQRARGIHIARCKRLGQYQDNRCRPIRVEFVYKWDADQLYENHFYLSRGVYINRDYNEQTENARRLL